MTHHPCCWQSSELRELVASGSLKVRDTIEVQGGCGYHPWIERHMVFEIDPELPIVRTMIYAGQTDESYFEDIEYNLEGVRWRRSLGTHRRGTQPHHSLLDQLQEVQPEVTR
ncbi:MAG: hypothetical protein ABIH37_04170 [archaeon]